VLSFSPDIIEPWQNQSTSAANVSKLLTGHNGSNLTFDRASSATLPKQLGDIGRHPSHQLAATANATVLNPPTSGFNTY
jgi:hypothetical protein